MADHVIDLGPEGGDQGGRLLVCGTPEEVAQCENSHTGRFLKPLLAAPKKRKNQRNDENELSFL